jgi:hypothetical protein
MEPRRSSANQQIRKAGICGILMTPGEEEWLRKARKQEKRSESGSHESRKYIEIVGSLSFLSLGFIASRFLFSSDIVRVVSRTLRYAAAGHNHCYPQLP